MLRMTKTEAKQHVRDAANIIRPFDPEWYKKVNTSKLDLECPTNCVLGQVFGEFGHGVAVCGLTETFFNTTTMAAFAPDLGERSEIFGEWVKFIGYLQKAN